MPRHGGHEHPGPLASVDVTTGEHGHVVDLHVPVNRQLAHLLGEGVGGLLGRLGLGGGGGDGGVELAEFTLEIGEGCSGCSGPLPGLRQALDLPVLRRGGNARAHGTHHGGGEQDGQRPEQDAGAGPPVGPHALKGSPPTPNVAVR